MKFFINLLVIYFTFQDHESFYHGRVFGEIDSQAQIHIDNGVLTASITISDETFHIEVRIASFKYYSIYVFAVIAKRSIHFSHLGGTYLT